jgi:DNA polymerase elongation subunit (family B)
MANAKVLFYDIETRPIVAEVWGLRDQNIAINQIREPGGVLCFSAKWLGKSEVMFFSDWTTGHKEMLEAMRRLWGEADAICGYNNDGFDNKHMRAEFIKNDIDPPPPVASIDLFKTVRSQFRFDSNKLDFVSRQLGIGKKVQHQGHSLWTEVLQGDPRAQKMMERYCKQDARLTEALYKKLRPFIANHPHLGVGNSEACPACNSLAVQKHGHRYSRCYKTQRLQCQDCGHWFKGKAERRVVRDVFTDLGGGDQRAA